jgi:hypothetical protein
MPKIGAMMQTNKGEELLCVCWLGYSSKGVMRAERGACFAALWYEQSRDQDLTHLGVLKTPHWGWAQGFLFNTEMAWDSSCTWMVEDIDT